MRARTCVLLFVPQIFSTFLFFAERRKAQVQLECLWCGLRESQNDLKNLSFLFVEESGGNVGLHASVD